MRVKLNNQQFDYLESHFLSKDQKLYSEIQINTKNGFYYLEMNEDLSDEINDWANNEISSKGFDLNYELTKEGEILEQLIDLFFID